MMNVFKYIKLAFSAKPIIPVYDDTVIIVSAKDLAAINKKCHRVPTNTTIGEMFKPSGITLDELKKQQCIYYNIPLEDYSKYYFKYE